MIIGTIQQHFRYKTLRQISKVSTLNRRFTTTQDAAQAKGEPVLNPV
jgi:hypothetical protein